MVSKDDVSFVIHISIGVPDLWKMLVSLTAVGNSIISRSLELGEVLLTTLLWLYDNLVMLEEMVPMTRLSKVVYSTTRAMSKVIIKGLYELGAW